MLLKLFKNMPRGYLPQIGGALKNKQAILWAPGNKTLSSESISQRLSKSVITGSTQLAFQSWEIPQQEQTPLICWVGLDIDYDDNTDIDLIALGKNLKQASIVRTSCSGKGIHVYFVLKEPIPTPYSQANKIVKAISEPYREQIEAQGVHVCKSDKRMFWFNGGLNETILETKSFINPSIMLDLRSETIGQGTQTSRPSEDICCWLRRFNCVEAQGHFVCYIGDIVNVLKHYGEKVNTISPCRGNGIKNGYLNVSEYTIDIFSFADGHIIWSFSDLRGLL